MSPKNVWLLRKSRDRIAVLKDEDFPLRFHKGQSTYVIEVTKAGKVIMKKE